MPSDAFFLCRVIKFTFFRIDQWSATSTSNFDVEIEKLVNNIQQQKSRCLFLLYCNLYTFILNNFK